MSPHALCRDMSNPLPPQELSIDDDTPRFTLYITHVFSSPQTPHISRASM